MAVNHSCITVTAGMSQTQTTVMPDGDAPSTRNMFPLIRSAAHWEWRYKAALQERYSSFRRAEIWWTESNWTHVTVPELKVTSISTCTITRMTVHWSFCTCQRWKSWIWSFRGENRLLHVWSSSPYTQFLPIFLHLHPHSLPPRITADTQTMCWHLHKEELVSRHNISAGETEREADRWRKWTLL